MKVIRMMLALLFATFATAVSAQTVKGQVVDENNEALIGVTVALVNGNGGAITDMDGNFNVKASNGDKLRLSYTGYKTVTVTAKNGMKVALQPDAVGLEDLVVVGYGTRKKSDVTGALSHVGEKELTTKPVNNAFEALQGKIPGVDITSGSRPGELGNVTVRGVRSINAGNGPLYVVDGVPLQSGGIEAINPNDIESVDVLKDASSTAIYGSRGANGVILITTKRGKTGRMQLTYNGAVTFEKLVDKSPAMTASDYITWRRWAYYNSNPSLYTPGNQPDYNQDQSFFSGDPYALANVNKGWVNGTWNGDLVGNTDWADMVTQTGVTHQHTISGSGGTDNMNAYFSFGYLDNEGTQKGQEYKRYNFNVATDIQATPWLKLGGTINTSWADQDYGFSRTGQVGTSSGPVDIYSAAKALPRYTVPYDENGEIINMPGGSVVNQYTCVDEWKKSNNNRQNFRALGSFYGLMDFGKIWAPLQGLTYKIAFGPDFRYNRTGIFLGQESANRVGGKNYASNSTSRYISWTLDNQIDYNKTVGDHSFGITLLQSASQYNYENIGASASAIPNENFLWYGLKSGIIDITDATTYGASLGSGYTESSMTSYMIRANYGYKNKYLLTVSGRWDGSSVLAAGHKWDFFPSAAIAWRADQEEFFKNIDWLHQLKVRVGVGTTGNSAVSPYGTLGNIQSFFVPFGNTAVQAYATNEPYYTSSQVNMANKELGWEKTTQWNFGVDFAVLGGRLGGSIDFYTSRTNDLIYDMVIPTLTGFPRTQANCAKTKNHGIEVSLYGSPVKTHGFEWNTNLNFSFSKDEVVELANGKEDDIANALIIGESVGIWYGYDNAGLWQESDQVEMDKFNANGHNFSAGSVRPVDQNGDYKIDADDRVVLGNKNPRWIAGWTNTFSWKGFELLVELYGRFKYMVNTGGEGQYGMYAQREIDYWRPDNTGAEWQKPVYSTAGGDTYSSLLGYKDASFIKLRNLSLGYNLPKTVCNNIGISNMKIYVQGKNLGNIYSSIDFLDLDLGSTYYNRGFTVGLQVGF
ncbi:MAG: TonB-dependent receptor [Prevotellaceae bacterium]|nr:TonB-dependent receptor [Prevotellaceae bacterium]